MEQDDIIKVKSIHLEKNLEELLCHLLHRKEQVDLAIKSLQEQVSAKEAELQNVERALEESRKIARETEDKARLEAQRVVTDAEAVVASKKGRMGVIEKEIALLEKELVFFSQLIGKGNTHSEEKAADIRFYKAGDSHSAGSKELESPEDDSIYSIKLVSFVNARHYVSFGQNIGPVHAHSWQIQMEIRVPSKNPELVAFAKIFEAIKSVLNPYENIVLNHVHPFNRIQPTTENIALYIYNQLEDALSAIGLGMGKLTVWETPTRGIEVASRYAGFETLTVESEEKLEEVTDPYEEVAATSDTAFDAAVEGEAGGQAPPEAEKEALRRNYTLRHYAVSFVIIGVAAFLAYYSVLTPPLEQHYPWGSDTWGHLFKAEYLYQELLKGNFYPQFTEYWYNGSQPFRYWAPLPYYVLALLRALTGDIFIAGNYFVFICALLGGLSWLFLAGRMGLWPSTMAGVIWSVWLDNVRVAFSEGNLPRVLATAFLPILFFTFLRLLEKRNSFYGAIATAALVHMVVLCHVMLGAVFCLSLFLFAFFLWVFHGCRFKDFLRGALTLAGGIASAAWWLLPGLTGGLTEIDAEAVKAVIQFVPASISFDPLYRFTSREAFYWGISLLIAFVITLFTWRSKPPWAKSLAVCGFILVLITFSSLHLFYVLLPLSHLLWPLRFSSFAALALLASCLVFNPPGQRQRRLQSPHATFFLIAGLVAIILMDCFLSLRLLAYTTSRSFNLTQSSDFLKSTPGWRVATIDLGRLESPPSYLFSMVNRREQVFGWAWQGAVTSRNIVLLNTGLELQYYPFLMRSCLFLGATDLIVKDDVVKKPEDFNAAAMQAGYGRRATFDGISVWHGVDHPYLVEKKYKCLVIGKYASVIALQFPEAEMGSTGYIDDYSLDYLKKYPVVVLAGVEWRSKSNAERIVTEYAASGGRAFVDFTGMPQNVLAKQPEFLGVYGESLPLRGPLEVFGRGGNFLLQPLSTESSLWKSYVPLGLDEIELEFAYYGNRAPIYGYKHVGGNKVGFFGGNVTYHAFLTGDPVASRLIRDILNMRTDYTTNRVIPLLNYQATEDGYVMSYHADRDFEAIVPVAAMDGIRVEVDGAPWPSGKFENLLQLNLPAGGHNIVISIKNTPIYQWGTALSLLSFLLILAGPLYIRKTGNDAK